MLCMSKVSKEAQNGLTQCLILTFLIFNQFLIQKKFWKDETWGFLTIPSKAVCVGGVESSSK